MLMQPLVQRVGRTGEGPGRDDEEDGGRYDRQDNADGGKPDARDAKGLISPARAAPARQARGGARLPLVRGIAAMIFRRAQDHGSNTSDVKPVSLYSSVSERVVQGMRRFCGKTPWPLGPVATGDRAASLPKTAIFTRS